MKSRLIVFILGLLVLSACDDDWIKKPDNLIPPKKMVKMLVDLHIANAIFMEKGYRFDNNLRINSDEFYYSVLKKYNVPDTVFEKSIYYYSCYPKDFEKIYADVLDKVNEMQAALKAKHSQPVDIGNKSPK